MKKINFITFFVDNRESRLNQAALLTIKLVILLYVVVIISMHGIQGYKWYQISKKRGHLPEQHTSFDTAINNRAQLQKSKQIVQEKILFFNQQKKSGPLMYEQLRNIYYNPTRLLTTATVKDNAFSLSLLTQTTESAYEFLKMLKLQPLIHKARIVHLHRNDNLYLVDIKGKFKTDKINRAPQSQPLQS